MATSISNITLFTTALCNLDCNYCYICKDKAGGLEQIDKDLKEDFKNNTQIKQILDYDEDIAESIDSITLWGGEPFLFVDRFTDNIESYFNAFPNLNKINTSTNFTLPNQIKTIERLLDGIDRCYKGTEPFIFDFQISIDGYKEMNDYGRGEGVTDKFLKNFHELLSMKYNSNRIKVLCHTKPTFSAETFKFVQDEEGILKWFQFFEEEMMQPYHKKTNEVLFHPSLWNCAQPTEWTSEHGKIYGAISKKIAELTDVIKENYPVWRSYSSLIPEAHLVTASLSHKDLDQIIVDFRAPKCGGGCGSFVHTIVPIPHGLFTMCHRGLFDAYVEYSNNFKNKDNMNNLSKAFFQAQNSEDWLYTKDDLKKMELTMKDFDCHGNQIRYTDLLVGIREYALAGIIDPKYTDVKEIEKTLGYFLLNSYCLQDAYIFSSSWVTVSMLEIPLLYNGVMEVVDNELERVRLEKGWRIK